MPKVSEPLCCLAVMCSTWKVIKGCDAWGRRQYSQRPWARCFTNLRVAASIYEFGCLAMTERAFAWRMLITSMASM